jgi:hypothetical protein
MGGGKGVNKNNVIGGRNLKAAVCGFTPGSFNCTTRIYGKNSACMNCMQPAIQSIKSSVINRK